MSDRQVAVLAGGALLGAWLARPVPLAGVLVALSIALTARRPALVLAAVAALASTMGARAWSGVRESPTTGAVAGTATLVGDPQWAFGGARVEVRLGGRRLQALARGDAGSLLAERLSGERVELRGRLGPLPAASRTYLARRHIGARLTVVDVGRWHPGGPVSRFANQVRRTLVHGAHSLGSERRPLFTGLVLGDDRDQAPLQVDDFRAAGLTHLLAVSGQNVAFVLAVAAPALRRLGLRGRLLAGWCVLLVFGVVTRWEPSVLRAVGMAAVALLASTSGRPASQVRVLALAVGGLVLIDPMLAGSLGFLLSAGACAGIALFAPRLQDHVPAAVAVTLAAQAGVAPILVPVFGGVPLASLPANLLAVPAAGPVMVWGVVAGLPAGLLGGAAAEVLHLPTRALLWWIATVAHVAGGIPLGVIGGAEAAGLAGAAAVVVIGRRLGRRGLARVAAAMLVLVALVSALVAPARVVTGHTIAPGALLWRREGTSVLVIAGGDGARLLPGLRRAGVERVDLLALQSGGAGAARLVELVRHRAHIGLVLAPPGHRVPGARATRTGEAFRAGPLTVTATADRPRLRVRVEGPAL